MDRSGRSTVAFGDGAKVQEFDSEGAVVWEIEGNPGYIFRAQRIHPLYHPGIGLTRRSATAAVLRVA